MSNYFVSDNLSNEYFKPISSLHLPFDVSELFLKDLFEKRNYLLANYKNVLDKGISSYTTNDLTSKQIESFFYDKNVYDFFNMFKEYNIDYCVVKSDLTKISYYFITIDSNKVNKVHLESIYLYMKDLYIE